MNFKNLSLADLVALREELKPDLSQSRHDYGNYRAAGSCVSPETLESAAENKTRLEELMIELTCEIRRRMNTVLRSK